MVSIGLCIVNKGAAVKLGSFRCVTNTLCIESFVDNHNNFFVKRMFRIHERI